jgi:hypothetical protein
MLTGQDIAMWRRSGSVYGGSGNASRPGAVDPYGFVTSKLLPKEERQELFSFAAASLVDGMGNLESLTLLESRYTSARLSWVLQAIDPYRQV